MTTAEQRARDLLAQTDLFDELGLGKFAAASRVVARDALDLAEQLAAERSTRRAMQEARDRLQEIVGKAAYQACVSAGIPAEIKGPPSGPDNVVPISRGAA